VLLLPLLPLLLLLLLLLGVLLAVLLLVVWRRWLLEIVARGRFRLGKVPAKTVGWRRERPSE
jgi:hypothetical protein